MSYTVDLKKSRFNPWLIILGCVGSSALMITVLCNTAGLFLTPVMEETGWSRTAASLYLSIMAFVAAVLQPLVSRILDKFDARIVMSIVIIVFCGTYIWSAAFTQVWEWNLFGLIYGICAAFFMYLIQPVLVARWFKARMALALSLVGVVSGVIGFGTNPWIQSMIDNDGWRSARIWAGAITLVASLILTLAFVRSSPEKLGILPYGANEENTANTDGNIEVVQEGVPHGTALRSLAFWLMMAFGFISVVIPSLNQQIPSYAAAAPIGAAAGAFALSILSIIGLPRGPIAGWFYDLVKAKTGNAVAYALTALGLILIILGGGTNLALFYIGVTLFSFCFVPLTMGTPVLVREVFGQLDYTKIYSYITITVLIGGGVAPLLYAQVYDRTGTYEPLMWVALACAVVQIALIPAITLLSRRLRTEVAAVPAT